MKHNDLLTNYYVYFTFKNSSFWKNDNGRAILYFVSIFFFILRLKRKTG